MIWIVEPIIITVLIVTAIFHFTQVDQQDSSNLNISITKHPLTIDLIPDEILRHQATINEMSGASCLSAHNDALCESGFMQHEVDFELRFRCLSGQDMKNVRSHYSQCAKSENGAFCGSLSTSDVEESLLKSRCSGVLSSNSCNPACTSLLKYMKSKLGCCINEHSRQFNDTKHEIYNHHLWSLCGVQLPPTTCKHHGLTFNKRETCRKNPYELMSQYYSSLCANNGPGQALISSLRENRRCSTINLNSHFVKSITRKCLVNSKGEDCLPQLNKYAIALYERNNLSYTNFGILALPIELISSHFCHIETNKDTDVCTLGCKNKLEEARNTLGCCLNYYNDSTSDRFDRRPLANGLWKSCGLETPGFCDSTLTLSGATSTIYAVMRQWISICTAITLLLIASLE